MRVCYIRFRVPTTSMRARGERVRRSEGGKGGQRE